MNLSNKNAVSSPVGGVGSIRISPIDITDAPSRIYSADTAFVRYKDEELSIIFAQHSIYGDGLESALSLKMHGYNAYQFMKSVDAMANGGMEAIADKLNLTSASLLEVKSAPKHEAKFSANIIQLCVSGYDATCDFYSLSPGAAWRAGSKSSNLKLVPIARVEARTTLVMGILNKIREFQSSFPVNGGGLGMSFEPKEN